MNLEQQVVSLDIAKRLKELGVKQDSLFWWNELMTDYKWNGKYKLSSERQSFRPERDFSAFSSAELGEMLPRGLSTTKGEGRYHIFYSSEEWQDHWAEKGLLLTARDLHEITSSDTEADARGAMLVYLLENKLFSLPTSEKGQ